MPQKSSKPKLYDEKLAQRLEDSFYRSTDPFSEYLRERGTLKGMPIPQLDVNRLPRFSLFGKGNA